MASPSSSKPRNSKFEVFCSFYGPDVRKTFLSHLREQFNRNGITMFDDEKIKRGGDLSPSLKEAIKESTFSIVILSKKYASSSWCLDDLVEILNRKKAMKQIVMTVFYGVEPSDVRKQTGDFGIAFDETCAIKTDKERFEWSKALTDVSNIAGEDFKKWDNEANMIKKIARDVSDQLNATPSKDFEDMVGLEAHLREMESLLDLDNVGVKIVGISGPAGIGKTTIARALQSLLSDRFQLTWFMDLRESDHSGLHDYGLQLRLQEQLLSKVLNQDGMRICHLGVLQERLCDLRVLIILDDVDNLMQLEALAKETTWFGPGSRIVVTTKNKKLLQQHGINNTYHVGFPSREEALEILCRYAFRQTSPRHGFKVLAETITRLCGKLPLALRVVGSSLRGKREDEWEHVLRRLDTIFNRYIEELGVKPEDNPFRSPAVTSYLKAAREMTQETECILVFSCNDNLDVDETSFIEAISKELHKREVTPLTYNLLGREKLDEEMLYRSRVGIMILSNSYVSSRQSLDHLVAVMEHWKTTDLVIIPIYFKVTLSDICGLKGKFEAAFLQLQRSLQEDRFQKWKAAVTEIVSIGGLEWTKGSQFMLAEEVVRNASLRLYLKNSKNLAGIIALLNPSQSLDAEIVGLWGMAGIGKTSIAREIFEIRAPHYDSCYFLQDFHLMCQMKGLTQLRDDFLSKVFGEEKLSIGACDTKLSFMKAWFHNKKILVVLDDVSNARDAEAVVGGFGWFSHGHTIILTSRRKQVLVQCKVKELYEIQKLCEFESFRLCKQYLNGENAVISELMSCSSGIPLALEVLVSSLSKQHIKNMKEHLQSLRKNPPAQIQEAFRRSFNGLDENEKNIFLDLACFFRGENKDHVVQILDACGFFTCLGICDLIDESLISLLDNGIEMPIPFQDIGRFVVREEDEDPCERSRLWDSSDITDVLINNSGTEAIEGIFLDASDLACELSPTVFGKMYNLRLLKFYCSTSGNECKLNLPQGLDTLPDELRLLHWENYPLENLPGKFNPENLVEINMPYSNMEKLWEGKKNLEKLKILKLSHSKKLTDIRVLSEAMNLEHIDLEGCTSLVDVSTSIPRCGKLVSLNMKDCSYLRSLPALVDFTSLKLFNFSGCSELEEIQCTSLAGTAITELPLSI